MVGLRITNAVRIEAACVRTAGSVRHIGDILPEVLGVYLSRPDVRGRWSGECGPDVGGPLLSGGSELRSVLRGKEVEHVGVVQEGV
jgi:hypothetical protein